MTYASGSTAFDAAAAAASSVRDAGYAALQAPAAAPAWGSGVTYSVGAFVAGSDGNIYKSLAGGNVGNNPPQSPSQWQAMTFAAITAGMKAADVAFHQSIIALGKQFNVFTGASQQALVELGVSTAIPPN